jgi:hypothetical protein
MKVAIRPWPWLAIVCMLSGGARATQPPSSDPAGAIREGRLIAQHAGAKIDVPLEHTDVKLTIDGFLAEATSSRPVSRSRASRRARTGSRSPAIRARRRAPG